MSTAFVEGVRDRKGGMVSVQWRSTQNLDLGLTAFQSKMNSDNYGRLTSGAIYSMLVGKAEPFGAVSTTPQYIGNSEGFFRSGASASSGFLDLDAKLKLGNDLTVKGLFSTTRGEG